MLAYHINFQPREQVPPLGGQHQRSRQEDVDSSTVLSAARRCDHPPATGFAAVTRAGACRRVAICRGGSLIRWSSRRSAPRTSRLVASFALTGLLGFLTGCGHVFAHAAMCPVVH